ncbi:MAG: SpoIIE family protein phosphatase [Planctomycetaceae bacterium]
MPVAPIVNLLLVEDSATDAVLIQASLHRGLGKVAILRVERLEEAIEQVRRSAFSAVLLDLNLPDSSGVTTFRRFSEVCNGTPVVVLSGMDDQTTAMEAVMAGAEDYVQKGRYDSETLARSVRFAIERRVRLSAEQELISVRSELQAAQSLQDRLYPESSPVVPGLDIASGIRSAGTGCGDYFDFVPLNDGCLMIVVGDVSGHGMGPAMVMVETRASLRSLADVGADPRLMMKTLNRLICSSNFDGIFVTLLLTIYCPREQTFRYFSAGQPAWILRGDDVEALVTHQIPLGFDDEADYSRSDTFQLNSGDILVMPTDGIQETPTATGLFGIRPMLDVVKERRDSAASQIVSALFETAGRICSRSEPHDDMTAVVIKAN